MSIRLLALLGAVGMILMMALSFMIPYAITEGDGIPLLRRTLIILSLAVLFVPILSAYRGYYQGHKEMTEYAFSQTFEQIFRVGFLLGMSCLLVYGFNLERRWALYMSVLSTSVAAVAAILQYRAFDNIKDPLIREQAKNQFTQSTRSDVLRKELITLAIPYLLMAVLGYSDDITYSILIPIGLRMHGYSQAMMDTILSAVNYVGSKLNAIPLILAPGFISALIPFISEAVAVNNDKKINQYVNECFNVILYIAVPISIAIMAYADGIYYTLFYTDDLALSASVLRCIAAEGITSTFSTVIASLMIALGVGKDGIRRLGILVAVKILLIIPIVYLMGYYGILFATIVGSFSLAYFNLAQIKRDFNVSYTKNIRIAFKVMLATLLTVLVQWILRKVGLNFVEGGKLVCFIKMVLNGILAMAAYLGITWAMKLPQSIFHLSNRMRRKGEVAK